MGVFFMPSVNQLNVSFSELVPKILRRWRPNVSWYFFNQYVSFSECTETEVDPSKAVPMLKVIGRQQTWQSSMYSWLSSSTSITTSMLSPQ
jgi:hypothetical protein